MVFYFTSSSVNSSAYTIYMGKDKYENEDLIKHGWPEDIWFHVDKLSSAHVYLRLHKVKIVTVEKKVNEILNRLEKTKVERFPDLAAEKECRDREERNEKKAQIQEMKRREKEEMKKKREMDELRSYSSLMKVENMSSNQDGNDSDEFM
uniref:coiled-coil domain-containing protein 25 isoform 3 n=1 Tax=Pongo abelii TaxID=9601 RepID=UPI0031F8554B